VAKESLFKISGAGKIMDAGDGTTEKQCQFTFKVTPDDASCDGICYMFNPYAMINDPMFELAVGSMVGDLKDFIIRYSGGSRI